MSFLIQCTNKKCGKNSVAMIDIDTNQVYCAECGEEVINLSPIMKNQLKTHKQVLNRNVKKSFSVKCSKCKKDDRPVLDNNNLYCPSCKNEITDISPIYKNLVIQKIRANDD